MSDILQRYARQAISRDLRHAATYPQYLVEKMLAAVDR
jgi:hypothetical protein